MHYRADVVSFFVGGEVRKKFRADPAVPRDLLSVGVDNQQFVGLKGPFRYTAGGTQETRLGEPDRDVPVRGRDKIFRVQTSPDFADRFA